jgi:hypothetical protein
MGDVARPVTFRVHEELNRDNLTSRNCGERTRRATRGKSQGALGDDLETFFLQGSAHPVSLGRPGVVRLGRLGRAVL